MSNFTLPTPILSHRQNIINGIIGIEIVNLDSICKDDWHLCFEIYYCSSNTKPINAFGSEIF